jgi:hypothetical protein
LRLYNKTEWCLGVGDKRKADTNGIEINLLFLRDIRSSVSGATAGITFQSIRNYQLVFLFLVKNGAKEVQSSRASSCRFRPAGVSSIMIARLFSSLDANKIMDVRYSLLNCLSPKFLFPTSPCA